MLTALVILIVLIAVYSIFNMVRMVAYLVGADAYMIGRARAKSRASSAPTAYRPSVTIVVPMHNEGPIAERTLEHLLKVDYEPLQVIVIDDGSTDDTAERIARFKLDHDRGGIIEAFTQENSGKAHAMNSAVRARATGELIMCLDGDSILAPDAVEKSVAYFADDEVVATASNVQIIPNGTLLGLIQRYEYVLCHQMKKAHTAFNMEYIIGGIGSMFRRDVLDSVDGWDTNTQTEDIDLTLKILNKHGNRTKRIALAHDSIAYTEPVLTFKALCAQRTRWKYGRAQTFLKHWRMFFSRDRKHSMGLTWFFMPFALFQEMAYFLEPMVILGIIAIAIAFRDPLAFVGPCAAVSIYVIANISGSKNLTWVQKIVMSIFAPLMYLFFFVLSTVEYVALMRSVRKIHKLRESISFDKVTWKSPERVKAAA